MCGVLGAFYKEGIALRATSSSALPVRLHAIRWLRMSRDSLTSKQALRERSRQVRLELRAVELSMLSITEAKFFYKTILEHATSDRDEAIFSQNLRFEGGSANPNHFRGCSQLLEQEPRQLAWIRRSGRQHHLLTIPKPPVFSGKLRSGSCFSEIKA
ncbi:hypothetical protein GN244_ATG14717 [Phytophthora infestans]|uniref:Uncharacterized protein n=1 Tax=Phytophthora infestans TaxID=4787 RepID=A0A833W906_PHYIN|nr:hypothetical protein GN244_ATG14717 [Phytophthora infestans]KAF4133760.1 hypothetical protein GN958_ATG17097 [Phytophthora infestans]